MKLVNVTPHSVVIHGNGNGAAITVPPSGTIARRAVKRVKTADIDVSETSVEIFSTVLGAVENLPAPQAGVVYIASALVAEAARRSDVMSPGDLVRDGAGNVTGCRGLTAYAAVAGD